MSELAESTPPERRPAARSRPRPRPRFALPVDHAEDDGVSERIEAFLDGRPKARRVRRRHLRPDLARLSQRPAQLDTRTDWEAALYHEDARVARYGRPASVLVVAIDTDSPQAGERVAPALGLVIRSAARETDRVARIGPMRFHVLLPETDEAEAAAVAERIRAACGETPIRLAAASPTRGQTLIDALALAVARVDR